MTATNGTAIDGVDLPDRYVDRDTAAVFLGVSPRTLATWGSAGCGPRFVKLSGGRSGAVRYSLAELQLFAADPTSYRPRPITAFNPATVKRG